MSDVRNFEHEFAYVIEIDEMSFRNEVAKLLQRGYVPYFNLIVTYYNDGYDTRYAQQFIKFEALKEIRRG